MLKEVMRVNEGLGYLMFDVKSRLLVGCSERVCDLVMVASYNSNPDPDPCVRCTFHVVRRDVFLGFKSSPTSMY